MHVTTPNHISRRQIVYNELNLTLVMLNKIAFYIGNIVECHDMNNWDEVNGQRLLETKVGVVYNKIEEKYYFVSPP